MLQLLSDEDAIVRDVLGTVFAGINHLGSLSRLELGEGLEERLRTMDPLISAVGAAVHFWHRSQEGPSSCCTTTPKS
ncbi:hypothetical protein [Zhihengliuella sp. ISTPL4]|uniref:hypothetical protein n=1 Tax=Zhihengliuella sp. ISTPL4 TaxID=2058657 RepID=UPI000C7E20E2|nr:hypothetical protein [Zhihengliuella sp. ISTPL4]